MQKIYALLFLLFLSLAATAQSPQLLYHATLNGAEALPAVNTAGRGLITLLFNADHSKVVVSGMLVKLEGEVTSAYLHVGEVGEAGDTLLNLMPIIIGRRVAGELDVPPTLLRNLLAGRVYANIRTSAHPTGEIRGQMAGETDLEFGAMLTGAEVTPPSNANGIIFGGIHFPTGSDEIVYAFLVRGLSGPITDAAIYEGQPGQNGPLVTGMPNVFGNFISGLTELDELPADFLQKCREGKYYALVKTAAYPDGEVRGQLRFLGHLASFAPANGSQQVPAPVTTGGFGLSYTVPNAALDSLTTTILVDGIAPVEASIRVGAPGETGPIFQELDPLPTPGLFQKTYAVGPNQLSDFTQGHFYLNFSTTDHPDGEIRGQLKTCLRKGYAFDLCGSQVVPPTGSTALGMAMLSVDQVNCYINYKIITDGLTDAPADGQIHQGVAGENGPQLYLLPSANTIMEGEHAIMGVQGPLLEHDSAYIVIPSATFPDGEIRGQIRRELGCPLVVDVATPEANACSMTLYPMPWQKVLHAQVQSASAFEAQLLLTDIWGKTLLVKAVSVGTGTQEFELAMEQLPAGAYRVSLEDWKRKQTRVAKIVVKQ